LGQGPRLIKKEFTGSRSHKVRETLLYGVYPNSDYVEEWQKDELRFRVNGCRHCLYLPL